MSIRFIVMSVEWSIGKTPRSLTFSDRCPIVATALCIIARTTSRFALPLLTVTTEITVINVMTSLTKAMVSATMAIMTPGVFLSRWYNYHLNKIYYFAS